MSLLQRVGRANQGPEVPNPDAVVPVEPPAPAKPAPGQAREVYLHGVRVQLQSEVIGAFNALRETSGTADTRSKLEGIVDRFINAHGYVVTRDERARLVEEMADDFTGFGPIEPFLRDETVTEVMVNGPNHIYIERAGKIVRVNRSFLNDEHVLRIIDRIITPMGRRIDAMSPRVDARLPDGSRVNAVIEPISLIGPVITVRKFSARPFTVDDLVRFGTASPEIFEFLRVCIEARLNLFVSGGTGSGKTTTLNVLSSFIPGDERIIVGECRSGEALDMLQAMTTGQEGSLSTGHANSPKDMLRRLETMVLMAGYELPLRAIREQIASAVDLIVHTARLKDGTRKVVNITEVYGIEDDQILTQDVFAFKQTGIRDGKVEGVLAPTGIRPTFMGKFKAYGVALPEGEFGNPAEDPTKPAMRQAKRSWASGETTRAIESGTPIGRGRAVTAGGMVYT